jgi:CRP-like cAMP-binding protein
MKSLLEIFNSIYPLSQELSDQIVSRTEQLNVKKKTVLLQKGQVSKTIYFIVKGALRIYYLDPDGLEKSTWLLLEGELAISVFSFFTGSKSFEYIEASEDCELILLHKEHLDYLYNYYIEFNYIGRKLTEGYYIRSEEQANNLRILAAKARYEHVLKTNPKILQRFQLGYVASYLGITQETLSRVRK